MSTSKMQGSEILIHSLLLHGVDTVFGYPGGYIIPVFDSLYRLKLLRHILVRHEQGALHAAQGYARVSGRVGVALLTSGPAATNAVTGIADAMADSTPLVVITGQVPSPLLGTDAFQETDVVSMAMPVSKWVYQVRTAGEISHAVARAFHIASTGRPGPVVLDITRDAQAGQAVFTPSVVRDIRGYIPCPDHDPESIRQAAELISSAKRPLALVGQGVILGNAEPVLLDFLQKAGIPAACTILGLSALPAGHPLNMGMLGMHGNIAPNIKTNECDVLIALGMRFSDRVTGNTGVYARQARVVHFDIDPSEIGKNVPVSVAVAGNIRETLPEVTRLVGPGSHDAWVKGFDTWKKFEYERVIRPEVYPEQGAIRMGEVIARLSGLMKDAVLVTDVGQNQMMALRYSGFSGRRSIITSGGLGTMGFGLPAAIGAWYGAPGRDICLVTGDGGIQMTIQELGTILQYGVDIKIILLNNSRLGMVRQMQEMFYNRKYLGSGLDNPDFVKLARAYRIESRMVERRAELQDALVEMAGAKGTYLLEIKVENEGMVYPMIPAGAGITDILWKEGTLVPTCPEVC